MIRRFVVVLLVTVAVASMAAVPVGATTDDPSVPTTTPASGSGTNATNVTGEQIQPGLTLLSARYDGETSTAVLTFRAESAIAVTLTDAGKFIQGGEVPRQTRVLDPGKSTLRMPVTKTRGMVGVSVSTTETLYAVPIQVQPDLFDGQSTWQTVQIAGFGGAVGALLIVAVVAWRTHAGGRSEVTRIA